jgi:hypothetical protein
MEWNMNLFKITFATLISLFLFAGCSKSSKSTDTPAGGTGGTGGTTGPTLASSYKRNCTALGSTLHGANYKDELLLFASGNYTNSQSFYSDSACNTELYRFVIGGSYTIGAATTSPANGYDITFTPTSTSIASDSGAVGTQLNTDCSTTLSTTMASTQNTSSIGFFCGSLGFAVRNTPIYNVIVSGATLDFGSVYLNNLGQQSQGAVATVTSISYIPL